MKRGEKRYIWQLPGWPNLRFDVTALASRLGAMRHALGYLLGRMSDVGLDLRSQANLHAVRRMF
jgi:Fic family protein